MDFEMLINRQKELYPFLNTTAEYSFDVTNEFEHMLLDSASATQVQRENEEYMDCIILDVKQGVELNDDKFILTRLKDELKIGEVLKWKKFDWLVVSEETNVDNSHNHHRLKQCNGKIKFTNKKGKVVEVPASMYNKVFYTEGTNHLARMIVPDGLMQFYVADNDDTRDMVRGTRIIVKGEIFDITYIDRITQPNLIMITGKETTSRVSDDIENELAESLYSDGIIGNDYIYVGSTAKFETVNPALFELSNENAIIREVGSNYVIVEGLTEGTVYLNALSTPYNYRREILIKSVNFD
nr:MAG TPA: head closure knob [Caudoviricetes sp.]